MSSYPVIDFQSQPSSAPGGPSNSLGHSLSSVVSLSAADADDTLTAAQLLRWSVVRKAFTLSADRALNLPSAAALVAAIPGALVGTSLKLCVQTGTLSVNGDVVVTPGTGGTLVGNDTLDQNQQGCFLVRLSNVTSGSEAYVVYRV